MEGERGKEVGDEEAPKGVAERPDKHVVSPLRFTGAVRGESLFEVLRWEMLLGSCKPRSMLALFWTGVITQYPPAP